MAITAEDVLRRDDPASGETDQDTNGPKPSRRIEARDVLSEQVAPVAARTESEDQAEEQESFVDSAIRNHFEFLLGAMNTTEGMNIKLGQGFVSLGNGFAQMGMEIGERLGIVDKGTSEQFTQLTNEERRLVETQFKKDFGDGFHFKVAEATGEILPFFAIPVGGATKTGRAVLGLLAGAIGGGSTFVPEEDTEERESQRATNAGIGAGVGLLTTAGLEAVRMVRNIVSDTIARAINQNRKFAARGVELSERTGIKFKLSQVTSDPAVESLEGLARGGTKAERAARALELEQPKQALKTFRRMLPNIERRKAGDPRFAQRVRTAFDEVMGEETTGKGLLGQRATQGRANFKAAQEAGGEIPITRTVRALNELIDEASGPGIGRQNARLVSELTEIRDSLLNEGQGVLTPLQIQKRLQEWGKAARGSGKLFSDKVDRAAELGPAKKVFGALNDDLDAAVNSGGEGAKALKVARDQWRKDTAAIREVEDSALGTLFGKSDDLTVEAIESRFLKMDPSEINTVMRVLENSDPQIRRGLQRFWLEDSINKARVAGQGDATQFVPAKLLDLKKGKNREVFEAVFTDPKIRKQVNEGLEAVSRLMLNNMRTGGRTIPRLREITSVIANRRFTSAAEALSNIFSPPLIAKYVVNPEGVKALQMLSKPTKQNAAAAVAKLMTIAMQPQTEPSVNKNVQEKAENE